jgi:nucleotide-binding universal stress UspA family protein
MKIVVGVDGSESSQRAVAWCAEHAAELKASVIAVHAVEVPVYAWRLDVFAPPVYTDADLDAIRDVMREQWCRALTDFNVPFEPTIVQGYPATAIIETAYREKADLVVAGRRGLSGFKELLLGSTTHHLAHHLDRPLVIIP